MTVFYEKRKVKAARNLRTEVVRHLAIYASGPSLFRQTLNRGRGGGLNLLAASYHITACQVFLAWPQESFPTALAHAGLPSPQAGPAPPRDAGLQGAEATRHKAPTSPGLLRLSLQAGGCHRAATCSIRRATSRAQGRTAPAAWSSLRRRTGSPRLRSSPPSRPGISTPG